MSMLIYFGINASHVDGSTSNPRREQVIQDFKDGTIQVLCNYGVLTTGFDAPNTDEVFIVIEGCLKIEFADKTIELNAGEMYVVPKGIQHKPYSDEECKILLVEPKGVVNTGEAEGELTASNDVWI